MDDLALVDDFIFTSNIIPEYLCDSLICSIKDREDWSPHDWTREDKGDNSVPVYMDEPHPDDLHGKRECSVLSGEGLKDMPIFNKCLKKSLDEYMETYMNQIRREDYRNVQTIVSPKFNRYEEGCQMQIHVDHIKTLFDGKYRGIPVLSIVGLISDAFDGGEFYCRGKEIPLNKGDILIFPSCFLYPHGVKRVRSGVRYSLVSWAF